MFDRWYAGTLHEKLARPYVHLVFGARQTGKSTLLRSLLPPETVIVDLANPKERTRHLANPGAFVEDCRSLPARKKGQFVFVDEAQSVPSIFDAVQHLYDGDKARWRFVLCGSSARKLRRIGANLLPGRSFYHRLLPLTLAEHPADQAPIPYAVSPLPFSWRKGQAQEKPFPASDLLTRLTFGELPGVVAAPETDRAELLRAFAFVHLEEEIRREALVKDWGAFVRFMELAAAESGQIVNFAAISQESGVSQPTVKSYYQLLEDMFVGFRVAAFSRSSRKALLSTPKFLFFDLGVRHAAAGLTATPDVVKVKPGGFFEQWVGIELWKRLQYLGEGKLYHLRTKDGAEVDFIIERGGTLTPIEVKWSDKPTVQDARHLLGFLAEHPKQAAHGFIVCRCPRPMRLHDKVTALPWFCL
ncbi:MAG: ATP-binding protein [Verrucomicrobia bacterium]|nr:ATP-binding protein [Verrucomicrobiota bacterium]